MKLHTKWARWINGLILSAACTLLVACGGGGSSSTPAPGGSSTPIAPSAVLQGSVNDAASGAGLSGVQVSVGTLSTVTNASGTYTLSVGTGTLVVSFRKAGYAEQTMVNSDLVNSGDSSYLNASMLQFAQSTVLTGTGAQTVTVAGSAAAVGLPVDGLRRSDGSLASGAVTVNLTPINPATNVNTMPGSLVTMSAGTAVPIESFGALNVTIVDSTGAELNLRSGQSATIRIPAVSRGAALPATIPLFHFNTTTGQWVEEGIATLVGSGANAYYEGTVTHFSTWNADKRVDTVVINGCVQNASGTAVVNARVTSEGIDYVGSAGASTDSQGRFSISAKRDARVALTASVNGRAGTSVAVSTGSANQTLTACLTLTQAAVKIKLSWGASPSDLDSHIWVPSSTGSAQEVYYGSSGSLSATPYVNLDVDDTSSFGPEYITLGRIARGATYRYWVRNYSGTFSPGQTASPARVELTVNGALTVFTPPVGEGTNRDWYAFDLVVDSNCNISVVPKNSWLNGSPAAPAYSGAPSYCN